MINGEMNIKLEKERRKEIMSIVPETAAGLFASGALHRLRRRDFIKIDIQILI